MLSCPKPERVRPNDHGPELLKSRAKIILSFRLIFFPRSTVRERQLTHSSGQHFGESQRSSGLGSLLCLVYMRPLGKSHGFKCHLGTDVSKLISLSPRCPLTAPSTLHACPPLTAAFLPHACQLHPRGHPNKVIQVSHLALYALTNSCFSSVK